MEVTNVSDKVTHAIIGKGAVEEFGMSNDAELYHILSSALYSRKKEAVVREVLCNAWDSHVESEITDTPVQITLDHDKLVIRDFGSGLHPSQIKPVYGTYGKSTKQHDGRVTGGFGLGSKAPFAYVDHFEVATYHDGEKNIYKMSQSNAQVGGKPSITHIVGIPTTESGLQVTVSLKDSSDRHEFETLIKRVVEMGDMNVTLNGYQLETIPFSEGEHGFMLVDAERFGRTSSHFESVKHPIQIRYGHVVYPLNHDERFNTLYDQVTKVLSQFTPTDRHEYSRGKFWVLVLQAEPHSISVTPSREDLSMTDKTVAAVTGMLQKFLAISKGRLEEICIEMFADAVNLTGLASTPAELFSSSRKVPLIDKAPEHRDIYIYEFDSLARRYLKFGYPKFDGFRRKDLMIRLDALIKSGYGNRGLLQSFRNELLSGQNVERPANWFHRKLVSMAMRGHTQTKAIDPQRLYAYTTIPKGRYGSSLEKGFVPILKFKPPVAENCLPFLRGLVILTCSRAEMNMDRLDYFPICKFWVGKPLHSLCYTVQRNANKIKAAREHFEAKGFRVLDLTVAQPWEEPEAAEPMKKGPAKPRKKGLPCLATGVTSFQSFSSNLLWEADDKTRIDNPKFIVKISAQSGNKPNFDNFTSTASFAIARRYGKFGAIVQNQPQARKHMDNGAMELRPWLAKKLLEEYKTNPKIKEHYAFSVAHREDVDLGYGKDELFKVIRKDPELRKHFTLPDPITDNESDVIAIFEDFDRWDRKKHTELKEIEDLIKSWKLNPIAKKLLDKISASKAMNGLDTSHFRHALQPIDTKTYTPKHKETLRKILLLALEG